MCCPRDVADVSEANLLRSYAYVFGPSASNLAWLSAIGFENVTAAAVEVAGSVCCVCRDQRPRNLSRHEPASDVYCVALLRA